MPKTMKDSQQKRNLTLHIWPKSNHNSSFFFPLAWKEEKASMIEYNIICKLRIAALM